MGDVTTRRTWNDKDKAMLIGRRFGRLVVVEYAGRMNGYHRWGCVCDCGETRMVIDSALTSGNTVSCGCYGRSLHAGNTLRLRHGHARPGQNTRTYSSWYHMIARCYNPKRTGYERYGGRGIVVCNEWRSSFEQFLSDMGECPSDKHSIDRIDNDGAYHPANCRWATRQQQMQNRCNTRYVTINGETVPISEAARRYGMNRTTLERRLDHGWSAERALNTPVKKYHFQTKPDAA